ncbi:MAG TPA: hypothetical protein VE987_13035, partial [Polyangiaceae bacterium]|nr:hypothetical protein [Polyangiaceae bacterium]
MQRLIQAATHFAACTHPEGSVGSLVLFKPQDTLEPSQQEPTGAAWCQRCGSIRLDGVHGVWRATLYRLEVAVAAGVALTQE